MRTLKLRFIEKSRDINFDKKIFLVQRKTLFGWKYMGRDNYAYFEQYSADTKEELMVMILDHYNTCKKHVTIEEHPTVKIY